MEKKIYCTGCGREIKSGLLYCDRCGRSVKKSRENQAGKSKTKQIEELHRERLNRKERLKEKEKKQREKRKKAKKHARMALPIILIALIGLLSAVAAYISMSSSGGIMHNEDMIAENVSETPAATIPAQLSTGTTADNRNTNFKLFEYNGVSCPYPASYITGTPGTNELMLLTDAAGGAIMSIATQSETGNCKDLMVEYLKTAGDKLSYSRASDNWYSVTVEADGRIMHRKLVIENGTVLLYDFSYGIDSPYAEEYEVCITHLDENFTGSGKDLH